MVGEVFMARIDIVSLSAIPLSADWEAAPIRENFWENPWTVFRTGDRRASRTERERPLQVCDYHQSRKPWLLFLFVYLRIQVFSGCSQVFFFSAGKILSGIWRRNLDQELGREDESFFSKRQGQILLGGEGKRHQGKPRSEDVLKNPSGRGWTSENIF